MERVETMDKSALIGHWAVNAAIKHQNDREALYELWNDTYDRLRAGATPDHPELVKIQRRIEGVERDSDNIIHDLLFAIGINDKPIAR